MYVFLCMDVARVSAHVFLSAYCMSVCTCMSWYVCVCICTWRLLQYYRILKYCHNLFVKLFQSGYIDFLFECTWVIFPVFFSPACPSFAVRLDVRPQTDVVMATTLRSSVRNGQVKHTCIIKTWMLFYMHPAKVSYFSFPSEGSPISQVQCF